MHVCKMIWTEHCFVITCLVQTVSMAGVVCVRVRAFQNLSLHFFNSLKPDPENHHLLKMLNVCDLLNICAEGQKIIPEVFSLEDLVE